MGVYETAGRGRSCVDCALKGCEALRQDGSLPVPGEAGYPPFCPTTHIDEGVLADAMACYDEPHNRMLAHAAAEVEFEHYCRYTRVEEIMAFATKIGARRLGIATCVGLLRESRTLADIFRRHGFEVVGFGCKTGSQRKSSIGVDERCEQLGPNMCNPILQAKLLNAAKTQLNVVVGLCVGHDSLFYRYSEAPVTTAVTKDRVLGHNPVAALYQADAYYRRLKACD